MRDRCWAQWVEKEARSTETSARFRSRTKAAQKEMDLAGLPRTRGQSKRAIESEIADERSFLKRAQMVSRSQFTRLSDAKQRALVLRVARRMRREIDTAKVDRLDGQELLAYAARELHRGDAVRR